MNNQTIQNNQNFIVNFRDIIVSEVIDWHNGMSAPLRILLSYSHKPWEYVIHNQNVQDGGRSDGVYTDDFCKAISEFERRIIKWGLLIDKKNSSGLNVRQLIDRVAT